MVLTGLVRRNGAGDTRVLGRLGRTRCQRGSSRLLRRDGSSGESGWTRYRSARLARAHGRVDRSRWLLRRGGARWLLRDDGRVDGSRRLPSRDGARWLLGVLGRVDRSRRLPSRDGTRGLLGVLGRVDRGRWLLRRTWARGLRRVDRVRSLLGDNRARRNLTGTGSRDGEGRGIDRLGSDQGDRSRVRHDGDSRRKARHRRLRDIRRPSKAGELLNRGRA
jgi:hypothetical protein